MSELLLINGPNLSRLGTRKPEIYGTDTLDDVQRRITEAAGQYDLQCVSYCSNAEGSLIDFIDQHREARGMIINPGALMMAGWSLRDALEDFSGICVEVHISNLWSREAFRHESVLSAVVDGVIAGMGTSGYMLALYGIVERLGLSVKEA
ncbi:type II 3-dehydroquinate dehydratase [Hahella ganghwensis]|uniref:type II 3-dehydroquinate dehydratase n=1 Tax=Hahella ganghwensis TaxID=286420 RepID=UPI00037DB041|nr:type II 3-dehydroquinate dehydratase [Hahella ganghwensis]